MRFDNNTFNVVWIDGVTEWVARWMDKGWDPYYINIMFRTLDPEDGPFMDQMRYWIERRFYPRFAGEFVHHLAKETMWAPKMALYPDKHVWKNYHKISQRQFGIENRIHFNGPVMCAVSRGDRNDVVQLVAEKQAKFAIGKIAQVHIVPISYANGRLVDYSAKTVRRGRSDEADIILLPRDSSEMLQNPLQLCPTEKPIKDIQSQFNLGPETASIMAKSEPLRRRPDRLVNSRQSSSSVRMGTKLNTIRSFLLQSQHPLIGRWQN